MSRVVPVIEAIRGEGTTSLHGIAEELNRRGVLTARGGGWYATTVKNLTDRATKIGDERDQPADTSRSKFSDGDVGKLRMALDPAKAGIV